MTKCDLTYEELVEEYEENNKDRKAGNAISSVLVGGIMLAILQVVDVLATVGAAAVAEAYQIPPKACEGFLHIATFILGAYVFYHVCITIVFTYRDEIEDFGARWRRFKLFEKKEKKMEEEL